MVKMTGRFVLVLCALLGAPLMVLAQSSVGTLGALDASHRLDTSQVSTASITVSGTYTGTVTFEVIGAPGTAAVMVDCATPAAPGSAVNSTTSTGVWVCPVAGMSALQARMSAYTDGSAVVGMLAADAAGQTVAAAGGGGSFDGVLLDAAGGDALTDTVNNALRVNIIAGAGSGGTAIADDAAFTPGTTSVTPAGATFDDVTPDSVNEGDAGALRMSANRNLYSTIRDAAGNERGANVDASGQLNVTGPVTNAGTFAVQVDGAALTALQLIDNIPITIGSTTSGQSGALVMGAVTTAAPSYTTAQSAPLSLTTGGLLRVAIEAGAGSGGTAIADDAAFTAATTSVTPAGAFFDDVAPDSVNEGDAGAVRMSANRNLYNTIRDAAGNERGANVTAANALVVDGSAVTQPVSAVNLDVQIGGSDTVTVTGSLANDGVAAGSNRLGVLPAVVQNSAPTLTDGRNAALSLTTGGAARVIVTNAAGAAQTLASDLAEDGAHVDGETGPLVLTRRIDTASSSAGSSGDRATFNTDSLGRLWVRPGNPCEDHARIQTAAISNSTSGNVEVVALNGSDLIYVCGYSLIAGAATGVRFVYGTGTACATGETGLTGAWALAANGGITQANGGAPQFVVPAGNAFCTENTGANAIAGHVTYVRTAAP